jgi:hypothetical protein
VYFRPSAPKGKNIPFFRITRASLYTERNAAVPLKTEDSLTAVLGFNLNTLRLTLTGNLDCLTALDNHVFSPPFFGQFDSSKISLDTAWGLRGVSFSFKTGYLFRAQKDNIWDFSLNSAVKITSLGRISLKIETTEFPLKWDYTVAWRIGRFSF